MYSLHNLYVNRLLAPDDPHARLCPPTWIRYPSLRWSRRRNGHAAPLIAVQTVLPLDEVPTGTAVVVFAQTLGGSIIIRYRTERVPK